MPDERCETCRFWLFWTHSRSTFRDADDKDPVPLGVCRRYPPTVTEKIDYDEGTWGINASPPETQGDDWCGEYKPDNQTQTSTFTNPPDPA